MAFRYLTLALCVSPLTTARFASPIISELREKSPQSLARQNLSPHIADLPETYSAQNLSVPIDHFPNAARYEPHSDGKFNLRYWFDASHYLPGGPVIVLQSGETSGTDRLPYLQKGILAQLAQATNGIGVVLEHRYYGTSFPTSDLSVESLRFLTTEQSMADEAYFARNVVFPGYEHLDLTAPSVAYIGYGGSYAGAFSAFLRIEYPDVFWGAISSSGVTVAIHDYWQYYEPVRVSGPLQCIENTQRLMNVVDNILIDLDDPETTKKLKAAYGLENLTYETDFANILSSGISGWQSTNWDPSVNDPSFSHYCNNITADSILYPSTLSRKKTVEELIVVGNHSQSLTTSMLNYIGYLNTTLLSRCPSAKLQDECFSNHNKTFYAQDDISQTWRSWFYQACTEWGYFLTGSSVPDSQLPLISRILDLDYQGTLCRDAFGVATPPDVNAINKYGGFDISYDRLAFIDGQNDPWRPATPHASPFNTSAHDRKSTTSEPFILIKGAVHHWDENGLFLNETTADLPPNVIVDAQREEVRFVKAWMAEWKIAHRVSEL